LTGGSLSDRKGVNVPGVVLPISPLTEKDRRDLAFGLELGVDWVALSFVQRPEDIDELRQLVGSRAGILAKLEKPAAIEQLDAIVARSDALMVARGDLGVELPPERVPGMQKQVIQTCRQAGKPVVVATQMLESMVQAPVPTRAEASDVATAIYDGADAVMLSAETAAGHYPVEAVTIMNRIIAQVEQDPHYRRLIDAERPEAGATTADAVCGALRSVARTLSLAAVVTYTSSGYTSLRTARERPQAPILSLTPHLTTARRITLAWGVHSVQTIEINHVTDMVNNACAIAMGENLARPGQTLVIAAGMPFGAAGTTNLLRIVRIKEN
jgi:pyruvate kinase